MSLCKYHRKSAQGDRVLNALGVEQKVQTHCLPITRELHDKDCTVPTCQVWSVESSVAIRLLKYRWMKWDLIAGVLSAHRSGFAKFMKCQLYIYHPDIFEKKMWSPLDPFRETVLQVTHQHRSTPWLFILGVWLDLVSCSLTLQQCTLLQATSTWTCIRKAKSLSSPGHPATEGSAPFFIQQQAWIIGVQRSQDYMHFMPRSSFFAPSLFNMSSVLRNIAAMMRLNIVN